VDAAVSDDSKGLFEGTAMGYGLRIISEYVEPDIPTLHIFYQGGWDLLPVALLCGLSILLTLLWLLVVWRHIRRANIHASESRRKVEMAHCRSTSPDVAKLTK
jgi:hypothetical protein